MTPEIQSLQAASLAALRPLYVKAITAQIEGVGSDDAWAEFRRVLIRSFFFADLIARAEVAAKIGPDAINNPAITTDDVKLYAEDTTLVTAPFWDAINLFRARIPQLAQVVKSASGSAKARAFWVTDIESKTALVKIKDRIAVNLEGVRSVAVPDEATGTVEEHHAGLPAFIQSQRQAAIGLTDARLETVYRTNLSAALNAGTNAQLTEPETMDETALWVLHEVHDRRTRGNPNGLYPYPKFAPHWQLDGFIEAPNHPVWKRIGWPGPADFNCRRSLSPMVWATAIQMGLATKDRHLIQSAIDAKNGNKWGFINRGEYPNPAFVH